jgi:ankyrin repeat protein
MVLPSSERRAKERALADRRTARQITVDNELILGAKEGSTEKISAAISKGANPDYLDRDGLGALHYTAGRGHEKAFKKLLERGADIHARSASGHTPLYYSVFNRKLPVAIIALERGAKVDQKTLDATRKQKSEKIRDIALKLLIGEAHRRQ